MSNYIQKSYIPKYGNKDDFMQNNIIEDLRYLIEQANAGSGNQQVLGASIWANGFRVVGCIGEDITLPANSNIEFTGPLSICVGAALTVPVGTTLTIV
jgi:hypothetical protein